MEDWIARAINSAKNHIQKHATVAKDVLHCNRWIASSALQKAIRRGEIAIAQRAAFALHRDDRPAAWRRLIAIAFEDIGPAAVDVVVETVAVATSPDWRAVSGEEEVLASAVWRLATAPKDRSADYLMYLAKALDMGRQQGARLFELRSATALARIMAEHNEQKAVDILAPIYNWFTEGFDTSDLKEAKSLLDRLT
jgi:replication-associated recombination protein RarA